MPSDETRGRRAPTTGERRELVAERVATVRGILAERDESAVLLSSRATFAWLTVGGQNHVVTSSDTGVAALLVTRTSARVLTAVNEAARIADEELTGLDLPVEALPWHEQDAAATAARRLAGADPLDDSALDAALEPHRSVLSALEVDRLAWLSERAVEAVTGTLAEVAAGRTEDEIAAAVLARLAPDGIRVPVLLVAADGRIDRYRHPVPTGAAVRRRVMLVAVAERWGLHAALTRILELEPPTDELRARWDAVDRVLDAMAAATGAGATFGAVLDAATDAYRAVGHPEEWRLHHQGGSIGYRGRERIAIPGDRTPIRAGMAFAWNPSITGVKAEATWVVETDGLRLLTPGDARYMLGT